MTLGSLSPTASMEFSIQEGAKTVHHEILNKEETIEWSVVTDNGYDIEFTVRARSRVKRSQGTWIILGTERLINTEGFIAACDLERDGIQLPVTIEFLMDNSYSWFNAKHVVLGVRKVYASLSESGTVDSSRLVANRTSPIAVRVHLPKSPDAKEMKLLLESRERIDLHWMNHVVGEALLRCPASVPDLKTKLEEIKKILRPHVQELPIQAII
jgi:hypothetical protein